MRPWTGEAPSRCCFRCRRPNQAPMDSWHPVLLGQLVQTCSAIIFSSCRVCVASHYSGTELGTIRDSVSRMATYSSQHGLLLRFVLLCCVLLVAR